MTGYQLYGLLLSPGQLKSLGKGKTIRVPHKNLEGPNRLHLTQRQVDRIKKRKRDKSGMNLSLSDTQIKHDIKHGGSLADLLKKLGPLAKTAAKALAPIAINEATKAAKRKYPQAGPILDGIGELAKDKISGLGFLSKLLKPIRDVGKDLTEPVTEFAKDNPELTRIALEAAIKSQTGGGLFGLSDLFGMGAKAGSRKSTKKGRGTRKSTRKSTKRKNTKKGRGTKRTKRITKKGKGTKRTKRTKKATTRKPTKRAATKRVVAGSFLLPGSGR